jgi:hypothetical protein
LLNLALALSAETTIVPALPVVRVPINSPLKFSEL